MGIFMQYLNNSIPIFELRRVTSQFMENAQMTVFPSKHQMNSWQKLLIVTGKVCRIICCIYCR